MSVTKKLTVTLPEETFTALAEDAKGAGVSLPTYCRLILVEAAQEGKA